MKLREDRGIRVHTSLIFDFACCVRYESNWRWCHYRRLDIESGVESRWEVIGRERKLCFGGQLGVGALLKREFMV